jgi:peptidoglycan hydrolase-like amidase
MSKMNRRGWLRRRLAFALALGVSCCTQTVSLVADSFATVGLTQNRSAAPSKDRASHNNRQNEARSSTRSRGAGPALEPVHYGSPDGPIIRIALMTDVTSVTLSCASGLTVNRISARLDEGKRVSSGSLRVELSQHTDPVAPVELPSTAYRVIVFYSPESRVARSLAEELKKKFFEPVTVTYDENQNEYAVLIGQCPTRGEASKLAERLRKAGYEDLRVVSDPRTEDTVEYATGASARTAKYKSQPHSIARRQIQLVAFAGDRIAVSSGDALIVVPAESTSTANLIKQKAVSSGGDERSKRNKGDNAEVTAQTLAPIKPPAVRVGSRDYRGEIHLVLNARRLINVVNVLPLEEYLRGVVLMEMPLGSPREIEALKAQAVAARSYALSHIGRHEDRGYDLVNDARAQGYGGLTAERELANRATEETRGVVAVYPNEAGKVVPIEALYTANCGGRTENNEEVFGGKARGYLRSVVCIPERQPLAGRDIVTNRTIEPLIGPEGRLIARKVATLSVLGFSLPRRVTNNYLQGAPDREEVRSWTEQTARLARREKASFIRGDVTRLAEFACLISASVYGEGASLRLDPADVDYLLAGVRVEQFSREARADVAMLLRDGILHLHSAGLDGHATITRGQAIETLANAVLFKSIADLKSQISNPRSQLGEFKVETSAPVEKGRLILAAPGSPNNTASRGQLARFISVNISGPASAGRLEQDETTNDRSSRAVKGITTPRVTEQNGSQRNIKPDGIEIAEAAWLFRNIGGESYAVNRLTLIGGERVAYHLNSAGQADFLEASVSAQSASGGLSVVGRWQERVTVEELQQRLARLRVNVGQLETVEPVAFSTSNRVSELEVTGDKGHSRLRGRQITSALGLKETLFVVAPEKDASGRVVAFVFTGQGWGHGVGMCQHGAYELAKDGFSYSAILQKYYTGVKMQSLY